MEHVVSLEASRQALYCIGVRQPEAPDQTNVRTAKSHNRRENSPNTKDGKMCHFRDVPSGIVFGSAYLF